MEDRERAKQQQPETRLERVAEKTAHSSELVHPANDGFRERITPKEIDDSKLFLFKCECGEYHFRHAGYMRVMLPFLEPGGEKRMTCEPYQVMICVSCKKATIWVNSQMYDVTDRVDLKAWEKTEREAQAATGPGGQC